MNPRRLSHPVAIITATAATTAIVAACGGSQQPPKSSDSGVPGRYSHYPGVSAAYRFSACMRAHGVSSFQDPRVSTNGSGVEVAIHVDPAITRSPHFKSAQETCRHILPGPGSRSTSAQQHARAQAMLAFAGCMRRHGFPRFPDPTGQGQLTLEMIRKAGIDLHQPAIRPAAYACIPVTHGLLTRADVNRAT